MDNKFDRDAYKKTKLVQETLPIKYYSMSDLKKALEEVISDDNLELSKTLLPFAKKISHENLLCLAVLHSSSQVFNFLIKQNKNKNQSRAFQAAINISNPLFARELIYYGSQIDPESYERTAGKLLSIGVSHRDIATLIKQSYIDIHKKDAHGETPLFHFIDKSDNDMISILTKANVNINHQNNEMLTPLLKATVKKNIGAMAILLQAGANPNSQNISGKTSLLLSTEAKNRDGVQLLIKFNANLNLKDYGEEYPLLIAVNNSHPDYHPDSHSNTIAQDLIRAGAYVNYKDGGYVHYKDGDTPLEIAAGKKSLILTKALVAAGAQCQNITTQKSVSECLKQDTSFSGLSSEDWSNFKI